jgi:Ca2+-binding RTX toxin-like protein
MPATNVVSLAVMDTMDDVYLLGGANRWSGAAVTYSFATTTSTWPGYAPGTSPFDPSFAPLTAHEASQMRTIMQAWDLAFSGSLVEVSEPAQAGQIRFAITSAGQTFTGGAPLGAEMAVNGDIWFQSFLPEASWDPLAGATQYSAFVARVGIALGLGFGANVGGGLAPYNNWRFTVMSQVGATDNIRWLVDPNAEGGPKVTDEVIGPTTPMVIDDYALMKKYGASIAHPEDNTYTWSQDHGFMMTILDTGGTDTIDLSTHTRPSLIDLTPASYSSIDFYAADQQLADLSARYPTLAAELATRFGQNQTYTGTQNLGIAYGTVIENVRAGSGADTIVGNAADNDLSGGDGSDSISGGEGADWIDGGAGANSLDGGAGVDTLSYGTSRVGVSVDLEAQSTSAGDTLSGFENASGSVFGDTLNGSAGANVLSGGAGGDSISARAGNDTIDGGDGQNYLRGDEGDDSIAGGSGFDDANGNMGNDTIHGNGGDDYSVGGKDNDLLFGDAGDDIVWGNLGNDTLDGGDGNDQVRGGQGDDSLAGGAGNDFISGDRGNDTETGGTGADIFHGSQDAGVDRVLDFHLSEGDRVQLDPGTTFTVSQVGADTIIDMGSGNQMILVGVSMATLTGNWIFGA